MICEFRRIEFKLAKFVLCWASYANWQIEYDFHQVVAHQILIRRKVHGTRYEKRMSLTESNCALFMGGHIKGRILALFV